MAKLSKDQYFMNLAHAVATKSPDPSTKHGCIAVSREGCILSTGYNGPPRSVNDSIIPLTRPEKYKWMIHSEQNCIAAAALNGTSLRDSIFYVTGIPCPVCILLMYQAGCLELHITDRECISTTEEWHEVLNFMKTYMNVIYFKEEKND
jgi:dCMP deaminase